MSLPGARYGEDHQITSLFDRTLERIRALPGVRAAGATQALPLGGGFLAAAGVNRPDILQRAAEEFKRRSGNRRNETLMLPGQKPPLDYRNPPRGNGVPGP